MIHKVDQTAADITVWPDPTTSHTYVFATLTGATPTEKAADLEAQIQSDLDTRTPLADLPSDDPDKTTDPAQADVFWDGSDLVSRSVLVTAVPNNGDYDVRFTSL